MGVCWKQSVNLHFVVWVVIVVTGRFDIWGMSRRQGCGLAPRSLQISPEALFSRAIKATWACCAQKPHSTRPKGNWGGQGWACAFNRDFSLFFPPPEVNQAIKEERYERVFFFSVFLKPNNNKFTFVATWSFPLPFILPFLFLCLPLPHRDMIWRLCNKHWILIVT